MAREFEIIGAGAIGALLHGRAKHAPEPGTPCANCGAELAGPYCHACGQDADDHHRSIAHLTWEGIEGLTHLDGRLGQTLPLLLVQPGRLARDHLEGRRARHVPPFRLFLISLLLFMFVLEALFHGAASDQGPSGANSPPPAAISNDPVTQKAQMDAAAVSVIAAQDTAPAAPPAAKEAGSAGQRGDFGPWLREHIKRAQANKTFYVMVLFTWAHRLAVLLLPILAGLLALIYVRRKQFFVYDHLIVAMQFLSFVFLIFALAYVMPGLARPWAVLAATLWTPINLYMTLRGAYGSNRLTAALKTVFVWFCTVFLFGVLMVGVMSLALAEM